VLELLCAGDFHNEDRFCIPSSRGWGILYLSRMYGSHRDLTTFRHLLPHSMAPQSSSPISHLLYCFTAMNERAPHLPETSLQQAIELENARHSSFYPTDTVYAATVPANYVDPVIARRPEFQATGVGLSSLRQMFSWISNHGCVKIAMVDVRGGTSSA